MTDEMIEQTSWEKAGALDVAILAKRIAGQIGEQTKYAIDSIKEGGEKLLERTWYSHNAMLMFLEAIIANQLTYVAPSDMAHVLKKAAKVLEIGGQVAMGEEVIGKMKAFSVGTHMYIHRSHYRTPRGKILSDHTRLHPGQKIGVLDITRNIPILKREDSLLNATKNLYRECGRDLEELALLCKNDDPRLEGIEVFYGISHLAGPAAERLGFDIYDIANPVKRAQYTLLGRIIAGTAQWRNRQWWQQQRNFKPAHEAFISRAKLVELFGEKEQ